MLTAVEMFKNFKGVKRSATQERTSGIVRGFAADRNSKHAANKHSALQQSALPMLLRPQSWQPSLKQLQSGLMQSMRDATA